MTTSCKPMASEPAQETDDLGNTTQIDWVYDELGRLNEEKHDSSINAEDYVLRFGYDLASNRLQMARQNSIAGTFVADETTDYAYDASDRLQTEIYDSLANDTNTRYQYTGTQQTSKTVKQGTAIDQGNPVSTTTYSYDLQGRLKQIVAAPDGGSTTTTSYKYNDADIRVSQTEQVGAGSPVTTIYHINPNNHTGHAQVLEEGTDLRADGRLQVGEVAKTYSLGLDVISQASSAASVYHLLYDGHGSTRAILDAAGAVQQRYAYDAYGRMLAGASLISDPTAALVHLLYSGEQTDNTGLHYLRARYYDPAVGRFTTFDPFGGSFGEPLSLHKYLYTRGNPITGIDPTGMTDLGTTLATSAMIGGLSGMTVGAIRGGVWGALKGLVVGAVFAPIVTLGGIGLGLGIAWGAGVTATTGLFISFGIITSASLAWNTYDLITAENDRERLAAGVSMVLTLGFAGYGTYKFSQIPSLPSNAAAEGGLFPNSKQNWGVWLSEAMAAFRGERVVAREVTIDTPTGVRVRVDLVTRTLTGALRVY